MKKQVCAALLLTTTMSAHAVLPTVLTDRVYQGAGTIDLFKDATSAELSGYFNDNGSLYLGVDLNESADGLENRDSVGVAIKEITLSIETSAGSYSYSNFQTNTTASILAEGAETPDTYYTLFGTAGSNQVTGGTSDFAFSSFDDVITLDNISLDGDLISAVLDITFVDTIGDGTNEAFFDYSAGFEEVAILGVSEARALENTNSGISDDTPTEVSFAVTTPTGTPEPWWFLVLALPFIQLMKGRVG